MIKCLLRIGITVIVLGAIFLLIFPVPVPIDREIEGIEINILDRSVCIPRTISIQGTYLWRLTGADSFYGTIQFSGYPLTSEFRLYQDKQNWQPALIFYDPSAFTCLMYDDGSDRFGNAYGFIACRPFFLDLVAAMDPRPNDSSGASITSTDNFIVAGASNWEEVLTVLERFPERIRRFWLG